MKTTLLGTDIERLRANYSSVRGEPFEHFYCPILHVDEDVPLSDGHIVPKSLGGTAKVLQRRDVDNGFGSFFEAEVKDAIDHGFGERDLLQKILSGYPKDAKELRRFKLHVKLHSNAEPVDVQARNVDGETQFFVKRDDLGGAEGHLKAEFGIELDARSSMLATALRTSHLCWFRRCGYGYVFSNEGIFVAWALERFYRNFVEPRYGSSKTESGSLMSDRVKREVDEYCFQFANIIRSWLHESDDASHEELQRGTLDSGWFIALRDGDDVYGRISIVKLGSHYIAVMTPIITDSRGWALFDLAVNLKLEYSLARHNAEQGVLEFGRLAARQPLIWPSAKEETISSPPISIREAAQIVIDSGRMTRPDGDGC